MQNLTKKRKQPPLVIPQKASFYKLLILCLRLGIVRGTNQGV